MSRSKDRTLQDVETFLRKRLPEKLHRDVRGLRIVKEADVECAAYFHLRRFLGEDPRWRVLARKHVPITGRYVDLLIFKRERPVVAVELKWGKRRIGEKDKKSLSAALEKLGVNKAYWFSALASAPSDRSAKDETEKYVFHQKLVTPRLSGEAFEKWKGKRARFRGKMGVGKGSKLKQLAQT